MNGTTFSTDTIAKILLSMLIHGILTAAPTTIAPPPTIIINITTTTTTTIVSTLITSNSITTEAECY